MFVANINENALAAVSLSFPITTLMISLSIWIGVGINVLIAGYLGEKEQDLADCATTLGLLVALIVGICINILALLIMKMGWTAPIHRYSSTPVPCSVPFPGYMGWSRFLPA